MNRFEDRKFVLLGIFLAIGVVFLLRLIYLQVWDEKYRLSALNQSIRHEIQHPPRGLVYDRNGEVLAYNQAAYDLMVVPKLLQPFDTLAFCKLVDLEKEELEERLAKAKKYSRYKASAIKKQITAEAWASIAEKLYRYKGFHGEKRALRLYPHRAASHVLGYLSEVSPKQVEEDKFYRKGDLIGANGLERAYEMELRGTPGKRLLMKDVHNVVQGPYKDGAYDTLATAGQNLTTTLDIELQQYGELLMQNKKGSIVAIEPSTGEILALVSAPGYDPNLLVGQDRSKNYQALVANDSLNPLFNRALMAKYPPGSIFKIVQAVIAMEEGVIEQNTGFACNKALVGCHSHEHPASVRASIKHSCNPYYYQVFKRLIQQGEARSIFKDSEIGLGKWQKHVKTFGLGVQPAIDLPNAKAGYVPGVDFYDRWYGTGRWAFTTIYSLSIGQGEMEVTPLQMANLAAIIANRGWYYEPHLVKDVAGKGAPEQFTVKHETFAGPEHYPYVIDAMQAVVYEPGGTARRARLDSIIVCGKTGTAENPHGEDHSVFMAFAPKNDPQIAIAVYIENAGFGGTWAAPLASLMMEKYLTDSIADPAREQRLIELDLTDEYMRKNE